MMHYPSNEMYAVPAVLAGILVYKLLTYLEDRRETSYMRDANERARKKREADKAEADRRDRMERQRSVQEARASKQINIPRR